MDDRSVSNGYVVCERVEAVEEEEGEGEGYTIGCNCSEMGSTIRSHDGFASNGA